MLTSRHAADACLAGYQSQHLCAAGGPLGFMGAVNVSLHACRLCGGVHRQEHVNGNLVVIGCLGRPLGPAGTKLYPAGKSHQGKALQLQVGHT